MTISKHRILLTSLLTTKVLFAESLSVITVDANEDSTSTAISATKIDKTQIENSVQGNGFISSLLDTNPNIEVTDDSQNSTTAGEITPGKISINEAPSYQNNFQIDGVSNDSLIDPNLSGTTNPYDVPGNEDEIFLDLDLIESIEVYDSGISAEYGNFTGGVIVAKTIRTGAEPSYKISYGHTSDKLTKLHVSNKESFEKAKSDNSQPRFEKHFYNLYASIPINDENGIIFSYDRKQSIIPGAYFGGFRDKERLNENFFTKWSHFFQDDSVLDITGTYAPYESTHFQEYVKDSDTKISGGGASLKANYEKNFNFWNLNTNLALKYSQNSKKSKNYNKAWDWSDDKSWGKKNTTSTEGGSGTIDKTSNGLLYNAKLRSQSFDTAFITHKLKTGLELNYNRAEYDRKENMYYYKDPTTNIFINCNGNNDRCVDNEQYFKTRRVYQAENVSVGMLSTAFHLEDTLQYERFELTPGIRYDYNDYLKNHDIAYRLNSSIKPFNTKSTVLFGGFNRYYGKSFLGFKLREARAPYYEQSADDPANVLSDWATSSAKDSGKYVFSNLDTPYTDEKVIGLRQDIAGMRINLKHVKRDAKAKFAKHKGDWGLYTMPDGVTQDYYKPTYFTNGGSTKSTITSLNIGPVKPIAFKSFSIGYKFSTSWKETTSNVTDYDDIINDEQDDSNKIYYKGNAVDKNDVTLKSTPRHYNLHINFAFRPIEFFGVPCKINLNNIIRHTTAYTDIGKADGDETYEYTENKPDGTTQKYDIETYDDIHYKAVTTLDLKTTFNFKMTQKQSLILNTEVTNVFDKVQNLENSTSNYKTGRQFWFKVAYKF